MMINCCSAKDLGDPNSGSVITFWLGNPIVPCVLLTVGCFLEIQSFLHLHVKESPSIGVEMSNTF